jgi:hypothetical protein
MDVMTEFELFPYIGAGLLTFGMSPKEVESLLGPPSVVKLNDNNNRVEFRLFLNLTYSSGGGDRLNHIGFGRQMVGVKYRDLAIFRDPAERVLQRLVTEDGNPYFFLGIVVLLNLGMTLTGFQDDDDDDSDKAMTVFPKGSWDKWIPEMKPFHL